jgi:hypothetical protein
MSSHEESAPLGDLEIAGKDIAVAATKFDRLAVGGRGELLLVSLVAETQRIKQIRAILSGAAKVTIQAAGVQLSRPCDEPWQEHSPGRLYPTPDGYQCHTHKLGYGLAHAIFVTRMPGFMKVVTPESLWQELKGVRFTTPILKEWMPHLERRLRDNALLEDAHGFNCRSGVLTAVTKHLDEIVSAGIQQRSITIPRPSIVA